MENTSSATKTPRLKACPGATLMDRMKVLQQEKTETCRIPVPGNQVWAREEIGCLNPYQKERVII